MRVLLVEDDLTAARGVSLMLKAVGAVIDHSESGEEALELLRHYDYDVVLLDLVLPDIEGYEVVRRMRIARNDTPVLILSGMTRPQAKVKGLGMGADDSSPSPSTRPSCWPGCRRWSAAARASASRRCGSARSN